MQPEHVVTAERTKDGWILVHITRTRYIKRFNLRDSEARQLIEELSALLASQ